jgi:four helix bundle protein
LIEPPIFLVPLSLYLSPFLKMPAQFDHERLKVYQQALNFVAWASPVIDELPVKWAVRDQLDRASTSVVLNLAEGNGKRSYADRCRYFDSARGSAVECAACIDVLVVRNKLPLERAGEGKAMLLEVVAMAAGLIARFSETTATVRGGAMVCEESAEFTYGVAEAGREKE